MLCFTRGKKSEYACGDRVSVVESGDGQGVIETCLPRQTLFYRSNAFREKLIAANVSQVIIVVACEPSFSDELVTRSLVAAEAVGVKALIVLNKCDLLGTAADGPIMLELDLTLVIAPLGEDQIDRLTRLQPTTHQPVRREWK